jgi:hypothetical protein
MLVLKKNIYENFGTDSLTPSSNPNLDPYSFIFKTLVSDRDLFLGLGQVNPEEAGERFKIFFPNASRFGTIEIVNSISKRLLESLVIPDKWYQLNAYHFCYLYDSLYGFTEEYSYENKEQRMSMFPELQGEPIDLNDFMDNYFLDTSFLIDPDRFNNMDSREKNDLGLTDPCLFGVINRLVPAEEEIGLKEIENPYQKNELEC